MTKAVKLHWATTMISTLPQSSVLSAFGFLIMYLFSLVHSWRKPRFSFQICEQVLSVLNGRNAGHR
jgi:hypothetical protein